MSAKPKKPVLPIAQRPMIGWREWVALPDLGVEHIHAKIDTGARTSSLHAYNIREVRRGGKAYVEFDIHPLQHARTPVVSASAPLLEMRHVKSSSGHATLRPVILTHFELCGHRYQMELTLTKRDAMGFRMLLGREAVRRRYLINPGSSYYGGKPGSGPLRPSKRLGRPTADAPRDGAGRA